MLTRPITRGRVGKWALALVEFALQYVPQKAVKGQTLVDFLADHPPIQVAGDGEQEEVGEVAYIGVTLWFLSFDRSKTSQAARAGIAIRLPQGVETQLAVHLGFTCSNNQAEYEALIIGMKVLLPMGARSVEINGDSQLVIKQVAGEYRCESEHLVRHHLLVCSLITQFDEVSIRYVPRLKNQTANSLAQVASSLRPMEDCLKRTIVLQKQLVSSVLDLDLVEVNQVEDTQPDWRTLLIQFLRDPSLNMDKKTKYRALRYVLVGGDLFKKGKDGLLLKCVSLNESMVIMAEVHEGIYDSHQAGPKMRWLIRRHGYYWPTILSDYIKYAKGCQACQRHGPIQRAPAVELNPVVKPWPFRGWAMDLIGKVTPPAIKGHCFIILATDYFTKWVEAVPMR
ncbi:uncharacterized protein LOC122650800 [Telopea speciosissima]|uniref:uncharacterized protein LOC122650800 n=1 Tax=Telopea speciosissima TaxID=54955 RepID=UPI001CC3EAC7|nr:uncharacterized protein LOC122650800 [Telopea speciosissima]